MDLESFSDDEVLLMARMASIHRVSIRRKLDRLRSGSTEHAAAIDEIAATQRVMAKLNRADLRRASA